MVAYALYFNIDSSRELRFIIFLSLAPRDGLSLSLFFLYIFFFLFCLMVVKTKEQMRRRGKSGRDIYILISTSKATPSGIYTTCVCWRGRGGDAMEEITVLKGDLSRDEMHVVVYTLFSLFSSSGKSKN